MAENQTGLLCPYLKAVNLNIEPREYMFLPLFQDNNIATPEHKMQMTE